MNAWTWYKPVCSEEAWNKHHWQTVSVYYVVCVDNWTIHLHPIFYLQYIHLLISHWFMLTALIYLWIYSEFHRVWPHRCLECVCKTTAPVAAVTAPPASLVESPLPSLHIHYTKKYNGSCSHSPVDVWSALDKLTCLIIIGLVCSDSSS